MNFWRPGRNLRSGFLWKVFLNVGNACWHNYCLKLRMCEESVKIPRSFQHTAFFLWPVDSSSSKDVLNSLSKLTLNLHPTTTLFPKVSRSCIVRDLHSKHSTFRSFRGRGWNRIKSTKSLANQFAVSLSSLHIRCVWVFTHESFMLSSLLGLRRPFLCSRVFCSIFPFHFWLHKGMFW